MQKSTLGKGYGTGCRLRYPLPSEHSSGGHINLCLFEAEGLGSVRVGQVKVVRDQQVVEVDVVGHRPELDTF